jgi:hypothetical protein
MKSKTRSGVTPSRDVHVLSEFVTTKYSVSPNTMRVFIQTLLLRDEGLPYFRVHKNKYEDGDYERQPCSHPGKHV